MFLLLAFFIFIAVCAIRFFKPKSKIGIWLKALIFPLIGLIIAMGYLDTFTAYSHPMYQLFGKEMSYARRSGENLGECLIPFLISYFVSVWFLYKKFKNSQQIPFPKILASVGIFCFVLGMATFIIRQKMQISARDLDKEFQEIIVYDVNVLMVLSIILTILWIFIVIKIKK